MFYLKKKILNIFHLFRKKIKNDIRRDIHIFYKINVNKSLIKDIIYRFRQLTKNTSIKMKLNYKIKKLD